MTNAITAQDPALQPAAAASRQVDAGMEATRKALDHVELEGRLAIQLIREAGQVATPRPAPEDAKGVLVDRTA
jgi:hypothetical protein